MHIYIYIYIRSWPPRGARRGRPTSWPAPEDPNAGPEVTRISTCVLSSSSLSSLLSFSLCSCLYIYIYIYTYTHVYTYVAPEDPNAGPEANNNNTGNYYYY